MKKIFLVALFAFPVSMSLATPPTSISLTYDMSKGNLHVEAAHESFDLEKSYVRLMNVYLNGNQVTSLNYYKQGAYDKFTDDVPLTAQVGDVIKVDLFCTLGGEMAQELKVTSTGISQTRDNATGTGDDNTPDNTTDNTADSSADNAAANAGN